MPLKRQLKLLDAFSIAAGAMLSSGLFVLPGIAYAHVGPAAILAYLLAGLLMIPTMLTQAELSTAMPKAGGTYFFVTRGLGALAGTMNGLANWFSISLKSAFALIGIGAFARLAFPELTEVGFKLVAVGGALVFTGMNLFSVKLAGKVQVGLTLALLGILGYYIFAGSGELHLVRFKPFFTGGFQGLLATTGLVFISFGGLTKIASLGEEIENPTKNIPRAMFLAFVIVQVISVFAVAVTVGLVEPTTLSGSLTPLSDGAFNFGGRVGQLILAAAAMMAFITTANAGIMAASRAPLAMSRDHLIPGFLAKISPKRHTPVTAVLLTCAFMTVMIVFLDLEELVKVASTSMLFLFITVNLSQIILRYSKVHNYRPKYLAPLFPYIQIFAIAVYIFLIAEMGWLTLALFGGLLLLGVGWYFFYARFHSRSQSALVHLAERLLPSRLKGNRDTRVLEDELLEILKERDNIVFDRFDELVKRAKIVDVDRPMNTTELFHLIAAELNERLEISEEELYRLLQEREAESTTAIAPGLAIPHVICPSIGRFEMMILRCLPGIDFGDDIEPVRFVFVLAGSRDERNFHLRALMAIAQIVRGQIFESRINTAVTTEELRDIILLSKRPRHS